MRRTIVVGRTWNINIIYILVIKTRKMKQREVFPYSSHIRILMRANAAGQKGSSLFSETYDDLSH